MSASPSATSAGRPPPSTWACCCSSPWSSARSSRPASPARSPTRPSGMIDKISGGNETANTTGGPGGHATPGGGENPGGGGNPGGGNSPGGSDNPDGEDGGRRRGLRGTALATCVSSGKAYGYCLKAFDPARYLVETRPGRGAQPGRQGHQEDPQLRSRAGRPRLPGPRRRAQQGGQRVPRDEADGQQQGPARALNNTKKLFDPRYKDAEAINKALQDSVRGKTPTVPPPAPNGRVRRAQDADRGEQGPQGPEQVRQGPRRGRRRRSAPTATSRTTALGKGVTETAGGLARRLRRGQPRGRRVRGAGRDRRRRDRVRRRRPGRRHRRQRGRQAGRRAGSTTTRWRPRARRSATWRSEAADKVSEGFDKAKDFGGDVVGAVNPFG